MIDVSGAGITNSMLLCGGAQQCLCKCSTFSKAISFGDGLIVIKLVLQWCFTCWGDSKYQILLFWCPPCFGGGDEASGGMLMLVLVVLVIVLVVA